MNTKKQAAAPIASPDLITSLTFTPPPGSNMARAMVMAEQMAGEFPGAAVVFRLGALEVTVKSGGGM